MEGPDGKRDCDVSVRGMRQGVPYFALVECKDWKKEKPVGIGVVDALDSKRRDLNADLAVIYSNSGFTAPCGAKGQPGKHQNFYCGRDRRRSVTCKGKYPGIRSRRKGGEHY
jgi:hypothetical protein